MTVTLAQSIPSVSSDSSASDPSTQVSLEIVRGRTRYPARPVSGPRFFIGSGASCDLCLGGEDIPALHTWIQVGGPHVWIEPLESEPVLRVNGEECHGEWLRDGDQIEIGAFMFVARVSQARRELGVPAPEFSTDAASGPDLSELSALELIAFLEADEAAVASYQSGRRHGLEAFCEAARRRHKTANEEVSRMAELPAISFEQIAVPSDLERLCEELHQFSLEIDRRMAAACERESVYQGAVNELLTTQQELVSQLDAVVRQLAALEAAEPLMPKRASA